MPPATKFPRSDAGEPSGLGTIAAYRRRAWPRILNHMAMSVSAQPRTVPVTGMWCRLASGAPPRAGVSSQGGVRARPIMMSTGARLPQLPLEAARLCT